MIVMWLVLFSAGIFVFVYLISREMIALMAAGRRRIERVASLKSIGLKDSLREWVVRAEKGMGGFRLPRRSVGFFMLACILSAAGFYFGSVVMVNPLAGIILAASGIIFPEQVAYYREKTYRMKINEQLGAAVRVFAAEYADTPHAVRALTITAGRLPDPIGSILRRAAKGLTSGRNYDEVLVELGRELDSEYGRMFVQLLRLSLEDEAVKPLFARLAIRISAQQDLIRKNQVTLSADRLLMLVLNIAVAPLYFFVHHIIPEAHEFFTATVTGRAVVVLCLLSALIGIVLDRVAGGENVG
ncbi:hypothetical protein SDD30_14235 [Moorella naiadis]|uniref:type II secretion system F family protein n=1 Tax=Moorella naiadis (nom. illeg.) TaxID=3093670 RepID=UPI003D9C8193